MAIACTDGDWPHKNWPGPSDPFRARFVTPYESLSDSHADVVVLRSDDPSADVSRLIDAMGDKSTPVIVLSPRWNVQEVVGLFQNGVAGYLVDGDYCVCMLTSAVMGSVSGLTYVSPIACAALREGVNFLGGPNAAAARELRAGLSQREQEIMDLASSGYGIHEVGERLGISDKTVRNYLSNIYAKLGARSCTDAVLRWLGIRVTTPVETACSQNVTAGKNRSHPG